MAASVETGDLLSDLGQLLEEARGSRRLVSATVEIAATDPCAVAFASRKASDRWFCWEQPGRGRFAIGALGSAHEIVSRGVGRIEELVADAASVTQDRLCAEPADLPVGAGPLWVGGMSFWPEGPSEGHWSSFPASLLVLPEILLSRIGDRHLLTACVLTRPSGSPQQGLEAVAARLSGLREAELPPLDPHPTRGIEVSGARPAADYERSVADAVKRVDGGKLRKVVLAREVRVEAPAAHSPEGLFGALRSVFDSCFCFCVGTPEGAFVGASPELLVRRSGSVAATVALAGSTRRSADPSVDDHLGEQLRQSVKDRAEHEFVAQRIRRRLDPLSVWVEVGREPEVIRVANIQHLATPIHAQLAEPRSVLELAGRLHPTPAVGAEPPGVGGEELIRSLEGMDRGWYAGPVGWMDMAEDGEFCVALRSALLRDRTAHLYAGAGIVAGSDPASELAETEIKLAALLPLLAG